jgi:hypothetical protein
MKQSLLFFMLLAPISIFSFELDNLLLDMLVQFFWSHESVQNEPTLAQLVDSSKQQSTNTLKDIMYVPKGYQLVSTYTPDELIALYNITKTMPIEPKKIIQP